MLDRQPESTRRFLLQTSILRQLNGSLCDTLTGQSGGETTLADLEKANLFVSYIGGDGHWYRYHRLFADVLAERLQRKHPDLPPTLHRRAARWYAQNHLLGEAIDHAMSAHDHQFAAELVQNGAMDLLKEGALSTLAGWLSQLPDPVVAEAPMARRRFRLGVAADRQAGPDRELSRSRRTGHGQRWTARGEVRGHIATIRAYAAAIQGQMEEALGLAQEALEFLAEDDLSTRCVVTFVLGGIQFMRQDVPSRHRGYACSQPDG